MPPRIVGSRGPASGSGDGKILGTDFGETDDRRPLLPALCAYVGTALGFSQVRCAVALRPRREQQLTLHADEPVGIARGVRRLRLELDHRQRPCRFDTFSASTVGSRFTVISASSTLFE